MTVERIKEALEQTKLVKEWLANVGNQYDYDAVCSMLKEHNMYEVNYTGFSTSKVYNNEPYRYGSGWLVYELPSSVIAEVLDLFNVNMF